MEKADDNFLFTPTMVLDYYCQSHNISIQDIGIGSIVIGCFFKDVWQLLIKKTEATQAKYWLGDKSRLYNKKINEKSFSIILMPSGAPLAAATFEELIACGADKFVFTGTAGSLQKHILPGDIVIVKNAIIDEGTSLHYLESDATVNSDDRISTIIFDKANKMGINVFWGDTWSIDAPYREKRSKAEYLSANGTLTVEMEISALFSVAKCRSVQTSAILLVSDNHTDSLWFPGIYDKNYLAGISVVADLLIESMLII